MDLFQEWRNHFNRTFVFTFTGVICDWEDVTPFRNGDQITVLSISESDPDEIYGVFAVVEKDAKKRDFPLCCIEAADKKSSNRQVVSDYSFWYTNRM
jgi:hypothetical protein